MHEARQHLLSLDPSAQPLTYEQKSQLAGQQQRGLALPSPRGLALSYPAYPLPGQFGYLPQPVLTQQSNGAATTGGTVGIVGAVLSLIPLLGIPIGLVMGVIAIIFSAIGLSRVASSNVGRGLATTGLVLGILTVIFKLIPGVNVL